ncbi:67 kDa myosin-cross-reactive antigen family protein [Rhodomicrobium vannielii ATCC 17100]|uniref:67 kDa myosin-cross-reactive antigen family protein n=1 Tax=Rhodomicrobium vannielii (strain ATCC 17100 / DSM 162 / LMG 4299 / NCIMB 10020 / ATH 3.1.1) TaxID=648757 RepID=E3I3Q8_RHOVT|nr:oleate hydratase [Rhodomicrobium vannielii]ADP70405.1 67 kDa myosin-cross-reactive antigen family protein [Rhodomicrobium vannielii ATCC 17100]
MSIEPQTEKSDFPNPHEARFHLIGAGISSLAAAAFLIRDGKIAGRNITIYGDQPRPGGSLDQAGSVETGYVARGSRVLEPHYVCTFDLFSTIPALDGSRSVTQDIFACNEALKTNAHARIVRGGKKVDSPAFGLSEEHRLAIINIALSPESVLGSSAVKDHFDEAFFSTGFWTLWATTFAFQPWHSAVEMKRYLMRFVHMMPGFSRLQGFMRTPYNQYDTMVRPLARWLEQRGVRYKTGAAVTDIRFERMEDAQRPASLILERDGAVEEVKLDSNDYTIVTLGSMIDSASTGAMDRPAPFEPNRRGAAWRLWEKIAEGHAEFGKPAAFDNRVDQSKWVSFTGTMRDPAFFRLVKDFTGNVPGEGGLITFADSGWLLSITLPQQPHFIGQPDGVEVFWGYGLTVDRPGNFVKKPMAECTGREIMMEVLGHLKAEDKAAQVLDNAIVIPRTMPYIMAEFLTRAPGDRPHVMPKGWWNLAFAGQFCELSDDTVFTVEYSVRSAQTAVYSLLQLDKAPPPVYKGHHNPVVLYKAFAALMN